jgi:hypothetical protein
MFRVIVACLLLCQASEVRGQTSQGLAFSKKTLRVARSIPDTVDIRNPNRDPLRCDSLVVLQGPGDALSGALWFHVSVPGVGFIYPEINLRRVPAVADSLTGGTRQSIPHSLAKLDFPGQVNVTFIWYGYDPFPLYKRSEYTRSDSIAFRLVFHAGGRADTLQMHMDRNLTVGLGSPERSTQRPASGAAPVRNLLGRRTDPEGIRRHLPRLGSR